MSKSRSIVLNSTDLPTYKEIIDTISRLKKDYRLLSDIRGKNDTEDPESFKRVAGFLELLAKREKRNLPGESSISTSIETLIQIVANHLLEMDELELKRAAEETDLRKVLEKLRE